MLFNRSLLALLAGAASVSAEGCTREVLISARDKFFAAGAAKTPLDLAGAKIALNNRVVPLSATPFHSLTGFTQLAVQAVDAEACQTATFRVSPSQVLSTRLKTDAQGVIKEVEFLQAVQGDQFFRPTGFPSVTPPMWTTKQAPGKPPKIPASWTPIGGTPGKDVNKATCKAGNGEPRLLTRRELIYIASTYADGLRGDPWGSCVIGHGNSCPRNENGVTTTNNCAVGAGAFGFLTRGRRWVADPETGVVLGAFYFDYGGKGPGGRGGAPGASSPEAPGNPPANARPGGSDLFLHEYFKVQAGGLAAIYAPMKNIPGAQAAAKTFEGEQ
jgi:hypothetical protein